MYKTLVLKKGSQLALYNSFHTGMNYTHRVMCLKSFLSKQSWRWSQLCCYCCWEYGARGEAGELTRRADHSNTSSLYSMPMKARDVVGTMTVATLCKSICRHGWHKSLCKGSLLSRLRGFLVCCVFGWVFPKNQSYTTFFQFQKLKKIQMCSEEKNQVSFKDLSKWVGRRLASLLQDLQHETAQGVCVCGGGTISLSPFTKK